MHLEYYGLKENPFSITTDTRFLYWSESHKNAFRHLLFSIQNKKGIIVLSGEVGTGKTTILNSIIRHINDSDEKITIVHITNSKIKVEDLFRYIFHELEIDIKRWRKSDYLFYLKRNLLEQWRNKGRLLLILDEAQNYSHNFLEEVRLLSNIEIPEEKLLQIILVGQPQLVQNINDKNIYQLKQRVNVIYNLSPLGFEDMSAYIQKRLEIAGSKSHSLFHDDALQEIYGYSRGIPRVINLLCDNALLYGYAAQKRPIDREVIRQAAADMAITSVAQQPDGDRDQRRSDRPFHDRPHQDAERDESRDGQFDKVIVEYTKSLMHREPNRRSMREVDVNEYDALFALEDRNSSRKKLMRLLAILTILIALLGGMVFIDTPPFNVISHIFTEIKRGFISENNATSTVHTPLASKLPDVRQDKSMDNSAAETPLENTIISQNDTHLTSMNMDREYLHERPSAAINNTKNIAIVKEGDTLVKIIEQEYGEYNSYTLRLVLNANPQITNIDTIFVGQYIYLPRR